jgi:hypothetical protein
MFRLSLCAALAALFLAAMPARAEPLVAKYLYDGKLTEGATAFEKHLAGKPDDDEVRFGLGVLQFFQSFEKLGTGLYRHGLRTRSSFPFLPRPLRDYFPENPNPEKATYPAIRKLLEGFLADLATAEATLARVKDEKVKLPLHVGKIKIDLFGTGKGMSAAILLGRLELAEQSKQAETFLVGFDRGDVCWLRGYIHFLSALTELRLALDQQELFDTVAHRFFENVETPYRFLTEEDREIKQVGLGRDNFPALADAISLIYHSFNLPIKEPARLKKVRSHLQSMVKQGKQMWKFINAETDDDNEWIPNPRQTGVLRIKVTQEMIDNWLATLDEVEQVLDGKKLLPFWRGKKGEWGVNLRKVFTDPPKRLDIVSWVQGAAALPYLEKGKVTSLADAETITRLDRTFGGPRFFGFALWFN